MEEIETLVAKTKRLFSNLYSESYVHGLTECDSKKFKMIELHCLETMVILRKYSDQIAAMVREKLEIASSTETLLLLQEYAEVAYKASELSNVQKNMSLFANEMIIIKEEEERQAKVAERTAIYNSVVEIMNELDKLNSKSR